jgi:mRNA interferase RelE/StbE
LAWTIEFERHAVQQLKKLDKPVARKITDYLEDVGKSGQPRGRGKALTGTLAGLWRYRIGDYRVIVDINDDVMVILAIEVGHRSGIYD